MIEKKMANRRGEKKYDEEQEKKWLQNLAETGLVREGGDGMRRG